MTTLRHRMESPLGPILLGADSSGRLTEVRFGTEPDPLEATTHGAGTDGPAIGVIDDAVTQLTEYFDGRRTSFDVPLSLEGSGFQQRVWAHLQTIPFGATVSYGDLARDIGRTGAARAVGSANARNPIAVIVPCHRVVGSSGQLTGYGGGLRAKRYLLDLERKALPSP